MTTFLCWLFCGVDFDRNKVMTYRPEHVRVLQAMLRRNGGHELVCVSDMDVPGVRVIPMPAAVAALPSYYPKLWAFSRECQDAVGERFTSIDLDVIVRGDLGEVVDHDSDFRIWDGAALQPYNSSFFTMTPGTHNHVWDSFNVPDAEAASKLYPKWCGDQGWIAHVLGNGERVYREDDDVIVRYRRRAVSPPPATARAIFTCGPYRPDTLMDLDWVARDYHE